MVFVVPPRSIVCTACGSLFATLVDLQEHWLARPDCRASLSRPVGKFGAASREHCDACHRWMSDGSVTEAAAPSPCLAHAYRGCPAC